MSETPPDRTLDHPPIRVRVWSGVLEVEMALMKHRTNSLLGPIVGLFIFLAALVIDPSAAFAAPPEEKKRMGERVGEQVSRGIIQEGLETLDKPENRARLARILNSPEMRDAVHDLTASFVIGVVDGVVESRASKGSTNAEIGRSVSKGMDRHFSPAMGRLIRTMVDSALRAGLADEHIARLELMSEKGTHAIMRGLATGIEHELGPALAATIDKDLGPALALVIERDILPAIGRGLDTPEMQAVVANLTRSFATEFIGGAGDAFDDKAELNKAAGKETGLQIFGDKVAFGYSVAMFVAFAFGTMIVVMAVLLFRNSRRLRKQAEAASQRETTLLSLIDSLESDDPQLKTDFRHLVEDQIDG